MPDARTIDPYDVEALERSLNDSATRTSTVWISFLIFALYLLTAATTVTHRQLLLAEPVKLPVLNIDLPLWGFFFLAPILFVIFHVYVLLQVLLLGRTAAAYNVALDRAVKSPLANATMRQRLANTLFAQIFAGSPREREGWLGWLLKAMAWVTLAIAPILILLAFQFSFLAYHSHIATWSHRLLILIELFAFFLIWPLALDAEKDFQWPGVWLSLKRMTVVPFQLFGAKQERRDGLLWLRQSAASLAGCCLFVLLSLSFGTFPGEPHVNLLAGRRLLSVECERWFPQQVNFARMQADLRFDRLVLPLVDIVDDEKLAKIAEAASKRGLSAYQSERTRDLRGRDLNCSDFWLADFRRVDLSAASLWGAKLTGSLMEGALLGDAQLQEASLSGAKLQDAFLGSAQLQGASLMLAQLAGAILDRANLQGATLLAAELQGASLDDAQLQGALLDNAKLQAASLLRAGLQGASIENANLQGATLHSANLQGASLSGAKLQGASFAGAQLQGVDFESSELSLANISNAYVWRARNAACMNARIVGNKVDAIIDTQFDSEKKREEISATPEQVMKFIERSISTVPDRRRNDFYQIYIDSKREMWPSDKDEIEQTMRDRLIADPAHDDTAAIASAWSECEKAAKLKSLEQLDGEIALFVRNLVCDAGDNRKFLVNTIGGNWTYKNMPPDPGSLNFVAMLARGLLGEDGKNCAATADLNPAFKRELHKLAAEAPDPPLPAPAR